MIYLGIDPGLTGAAAFLIEDDVTWKQSVEIHDAPTMIVKSGKKNRTELVPQAMAEIVGKFQRVAAGEHVAVMELVNASPQMGVTSAFHFGHGAGIWIGIMAAYGIPYHLVHPSRWKRDIMQDMGKEKDAARLLASRLFPEYHALFARAKDDGRAEALLLAEYARRHLSGRPAAAEARQPSLHLG